MGLNLDTGINLDAFMWVNRFAQHTHWLNSPMQDYAKFGVAVFAALLLAGLWVRRHSDDTSLAKAGWACLATLIAVGVNQPIVHLIDEARPYATHHDILVLAAPSTDPGFPSDHATMAGAVAVGLLLVSRRLGIVAAAAALLLAFSRVYIAAHYPADVLAGLILGALIANLGWILTRRQLVPLTHRLRRLPGLSNAFAQHTEPRRI